MENEPKRENKPEAVPDLEREKMEAALERLYKIAEAAVAEWASRAPLN